MIDLDIRYVGNKSVWLDLKILFKTIPAILSQTKQLNEESRPEFQNAQPQER
jgi:lipopolysaccharide/colanic/teichoic acid biosynthesis glycosyltransferase